MVFHPLKNKFFFTENIYCCLINVGILKRKKITKSLVFRQKQKALQGILIIIIIMIIMIIKIIIIV